MKLTGFVLLKTVFEVVNVIWTIVFWVTLMTPAMFSALVWVPPPQVNWPVSASKESVRLMTGGSESATCWLREDLCSISANIRVSFLSFDITSNILARTGNTSARGLPAFIPEGRRWPEPSPCSLPTSPGVLRHTATETLLRWLPHGAMAGSVTGRERYSCLALELCAMTNPAPKSAYAAAGVDIDAQEKGLARVKKLAKS